MALQTGQGPGCSRRILLKAGAALLLGVTQADGKADAETPEKKDAFFTGRGIVIVPTEAGDMGLPDHARAWGLNVLDLGHYAEWAAGTEEGRKLVEACRKHGVGFEFSLHVGSWFLPRALFQKDPAMFRMDDAGTRTPDANLCVHSEAALGILCENAVKYADILRPSTGRYHYWIDDGQPMCRCPKCRTLSDSEQALIVENRLLKALRQGDPRARVAHLAYQRTMSPPRHIKPEPGIFLEFAPIERDSLQPLSGGPPANRKALDSLDANLQIFERSEAEVLEYWLDNSRYSGWKRENIRQVPWSRKAFLEDLRTYAARGIRRIRTYAFWFDADYVKQYGPPPLAEYGAGLRRWRMERGRAVEQDGDQAKNQRRTRPRK